MIFLFICITAGNSYAALLPTKPGDSGVEEGIHWNAYVLEEGDTPKKIFKNYAKGAIRFNRMAKHFWTSGRAVKKPIDEDIKKLKKWTPMPKTCEACTDWKGKKIKKCIVISLSKQFLAVYKNGKMKVSYPISTGIPEYETSTGTFRVKSSSPNKTEKFKKIFSHTYKTWMHWPLSIGHEIFIHAGDLPGYPASHGCIRLMRRSAYVVFRLSPIGTPVIIID